MQHRDVSEPIERIVREWAQREDVPALRYGELTRDLVAEAHDLVQRSRVEAHRDGQTDILTQVNAAVVAINDQLAFLRLATNKDSADSARIVGMEDALREIQKAVTA